MPYYLGDTALRSELHPIKKAQHGVVRYHKAALQGALQPEKNSTAPCATARETQHYAARYCQRGTARRSAPQQSTPVIMRVPALSFPDSGLHARGATPTGRRPPMDFLYRPQKLGPPSRVNLLLRGGGRARARKTQVKPTGRPGSCG